MYFWRIDWRKVFSLGEVVCFVATWVISLWATVQGLQSTSPTTGSPMFASSGNLPVAAAALE